MKRLLLLICALCALLSCTKENFSLRDAFQEEGGIYAVRGSEVLFDFQENTCQWLYVPSTKVFKVFDDDMSNWLIFDTKGANLADGSTFYANLEWTTSRDLLSLKNISFQLLKVVDGVYYFWSSSHNIALRLRME